MSFKRISVLLGLSALTVVSSTLTARAETPTNNSAFEHSESSATTLQAIQPAGNPVVTIDSHTLDSTSSFRGSEFSTKGAEFSTAPVQAFEPALAPITAVDPNASKVAVTPTLKDPAGQTSVQQIKLADNNKYQTDTPSLQQTTVRKDQPASANVARVNTHSPIPGTVETSATALTASLKPSPTSAVSSEKTGITTAQVNINTDPGRVTQGGYSYIAVGGNLGLSGGNALGDGNFAVTSKIGLTRTLSFRPGVVIGDNTTILLPLTYDFVIQSADPFAPVAFAPYLGGGVGVVTNGDVGFLLTGGVDFPLSREFVANAALNVNFAGDTDVGLFLGIGYRFPNLFR